MDVPDRMRIAIEVFFDLQEFWTTSIAKWNPSLGMWQVAEADRPKAAVAVVRVFASRVYSQQIPIQAMYEAGDVEIIWDESGTSCIIGIVGEGVTADEYQSAVRVLGAFARKDS